MYGLADDSQTKRKGGARRRRGDRRVTGGRCKGRYVGRGYRGNKADGRWERG